MKNQKLFKQLPARGITLKEKFGDRPYYILSEANGMSAFEYTEGFTIAR